MTGTVRPLHPHAVEASTSLKADFARDARLRSPLDGCGKDHTRSGLLSRSARNHKVQVHTCAREGVELSGQSARFIFDGSGPCVHALHFQRHSAFLELKIHNPSYPECSAQRIQSRRMTSNAVSMKASLASLAPAQ